MIIGLVAFALFGALVGAAFGVGMRGRPGALLGLGLGVMVALMGVAIFVTAAQCHDTPAGPMHWLCRRVLDAFSIRSIVVVGFPVAGLVAIGLYWRLVRG